MTSHSYNVFDTVKIYSEIDKVIDYYYLDVNLLYIFYNLSSKFMKILCEIVPKGLSEIQTYYIFFLFSYLRSLSSCHPAWATLSSWMNLRWKEQIHWHIPFFIKAWLMFNAECSGKVADINYFTLQKFDFCTFLPLSLVRIENKIFIHKLQNIYPPKQKVLSFIFFLIILCVLIS